MGRFGAPGMCAIAAGTLQAKLAQAMRKSFTGRGWRFRWGRCADPSFTTPVRAARRPKARASAVYLPMGRRFVWKRRHGINAAEGAGRDAYRHRVRHHASELDACVQVNWRPFW